MSALRVLFVTVSLGVLFLFLSLIMCAQGWAEGNIGVSYSQLPGDISIGVTGNYEKEFNIGKLDISAQAQKGQLVLADAHIGFNFQWDKFGINPYLDANGKGEDTSDLGGKLDYGATINFSGHEVSELGVGIFLRNADPFLEPVTGKYIEGEWIEDVPSFGINYDNPSKLNVLGYKSFNFDKFDMKLQGSYGLVTRDIWLVLDINTDFDLRIVDLNLGLSIGNRWYSNDKGENLSKVDTAVITTVTRSW